MNVNLDPESLRDVVSAAILKSLDDGKRDALIEGAIKYLLTPQGGSTYQKAESPLQAAFNNAVGIVAQRIATEHLADNAEVKAKIQDLLQAAFTKVMEKNREQTIDKMAEAITKGLTGNDRY